MFFEYSKVRDELNIIKLKLNDIEGIEKYWKGLENYIVSNLSLIWFWKFVFKKNRPRIVFLSNYATYFGQSLAFICREYGIPCIDVQHGVQGGRHFAYRKFRKDGELIYNTLPSVFYSWDSFSANYLRSWVSAFRSVEVKGIPSVDVYKGESVNFPWSKHSIVYLFTVSRLSDYSIVCRLIKKYPESTWLIRLHPSLKDLAEEWETSLKSNFEASIYVELPTRAPLRDVLLTSHLHFTMFSSVAIEASLIGLKTVFFDPLAEEMFPELIKNGIGTFENI
jgi:hypothetical protein